MLYIGQQRRNYDRFIANQFEASSQFGYTPSKYPISINGFFENIKTNYKWLSSTLYTVFYLFLSSLVCFVFFSNYNIAVQMLYFNIILLVIIAFLIGLSVITHEYRYGYSLAQALKKMVQSPLPTLIVIMYFWKIKKP
ncbi:MAG: hypothetical protein SFY32_06790 [Bacteroidota bacterium]|nr:hypothetical protein [Bacteroidota bacterium]